MRSLTNRFFAALAVLVLASAAWAGESGGSYLGVDVDDVSSARMQALKLKSESGVEITMVDNDAPAGKAGLKEHDVILQFNGQPVGSVEQLRRMIRETPPGRTVQLTISRDGNQQTVPVTLADKAKVYTMVQPKVWVPRPPQPPLAPRMQIDIPEIYVMPSTSRVGLMLETLTPQLGEFFGVKNGEGLLVRSVEKGSPAESAGFKAGDVIVKVEQERVSDRGDWRSALRNKAGKVPVGIVRDKREQTLTLTLPEKKQSSNKNRIIVLPDLDFDFDFDFGEMGAIAPQAIDLAMLKARTELEKDKAEIKREMSKAKEQIKRDMQRQKEELKKQQKELKEMREKEPQDDDPE